MADDGRKKPPPRPVYPRPVPQEPFRNLTEPSHVEQAATMKDVISLGIGEPDFVTPADISAAGIQSILDGYTGYLVADAHVVYNHLYRDGQVVEVGCWAHSRRYFFKALASDPERAEAALAYMAALFKIEGTIADEPRKKKEAVRDKKSRPIVRDFFNWCQAERDLVLDD